MSSKTPSTTTRLSALGVLIAISAAASGANIKATDTPPEQRLMLAESAVSQANGQDDYSQMMDIFTTSYAPQELPRRGPTDSEKAAAVISAAVVGPVFDVGVIPAGGSAPDVGGAVGKKHAISLQNVGRATHMKSGVLSSNSTHKAFWSPVMSTDQFSTAYDPRIVQDFASSPTSPRFQ